MNQEMLHAFGVIDASLELLPGEFVGNSADHGLLPPVRRRRRASRRRIWRRGMRYGGVRWRRRTGSVAASVWRRTGSVTASVWRRSGSVTASVRRRSFAGIKDVGDRLANSAADRSRASRELEWRSASRAVDQHHR